MSTYRSSLVRSVFDRLDSDRDGRLSEKEMRAFAGHTGYECSEAAWTTEFQTLCVDNGKQPVDGVDYPFFCKLINDQDQSSCYCTDSELQVMLAKLGGPAVGVPKAHGGAGPHVTEKGLSKAAGPPVADRQALVRSVFQAFDVDQDGRLNKQEMRAFAESTGFDGGDAAWDEAYEVLCKEKKRDPVFGVDLNFFSSLVNDKEDAAGCYCTDVELSSAITKVATAGVVIATLPQSTPKAKAPPPAGDAGPANAHLSRGQLIEVVFNTLDGDKDGRLNQREMKVFAKFTGFEGSEAEWDEAYKSLCADAGGGSSVDLRGFTTIVDDPTDETTDSDLRNMLEKLRVAVPVMVPPATPPPPIAGASASAGETIPGGASRDELVRAVFAALDADKDAVLSQWEMYAFAERIGFRGGSLKASKDDALTRDIAFFQRLVDDKSAETGCYCTEEELRSTLEKLSAHNAASAKARSKASSMARPAEQSRPELVKALFLRLDVDRDGKLSPSEMRRFAELQDFEGSEGDWADAYKELCTEKGRDPAHGVDLSLFLQLVDDESEETGCYCTDDEMRTMLTKLPSS